MDLLRLQPVVDRLDRVSCPALKAVGTAADLAAVKSASTAAACAAFVVLLGANGLEIQEGSGPLRQTFDVTIGVVLRTSVAGAEGAAGLKKLEEPTGQVRARLFGWEHPDAQRKFAIAGESLEDFDPKTGLVLYRVDFITRVRLVEPLQ